MKALISAVVAAFVFVGPMSTPEAGRPGRIVILKKRPPRKLRSLSSFLRKFGTRDVWPDKRKKSQWYFDFMAFFPRKLNELELKVKFYDVTSAKKFVAGDSIYLSRRGERVLASDMVLEKPNFQPGRKYAMQLLTPRKQLVASTVFWLRGKKETYSGRVVFSDGETR